MKNLMLLLVMVLFVNCSEENKVITAEKLSGALSYTLVNSFDCGNTKAVQEDVKKAVEKAFGLKEEQGIVQEFCKKTVEELVPALVGTAVPQAWECKLTKLENASEVLSTLVCKNIKY